MPPRQRLGSGIHGGCLDTTRSQTSILAWTRPSPTSRPGIDAPRSRSPLRGGLGMLPPMWPNGTNEESTTEEPHSENGVGNDAGGVHKQIVLPFADDRDQGDDEGPATAAIEMPEEPPEISPALAPDPSRRLPLRERLALKNKRLAGTAPLGDDAQTAMSSSAPAEDAEPQNEGVDPQADQSTRLPPEEEGEQEAAASPPRAAATPCRATAAAASGKAAAQGKKKRRRAANPKAEEPNGEAELPSHRALGGLSLPWRLTLNGAGGLGQHFQQALTSSRKTTALGKDAHQASTSAAATSSDFVGRSPFLPPEGSEVDSGHGESLEHRRSPSPPSQPSRSRRSAASSPESVGEGGLADTSVEGLSGHDLQYTDHVPGCGIGSSGHSVKDLKTLLSRHGVDFAGCVEKADLQRLLDRFRALKALPLAELRRQCVQYGGDARLATGTVDEMARYLLARRKRDAAKSSVDAASVADERRPASATAPASAAVNSPAASSAAKAGEGNGQERRLREQTAAGEVARILPLRREVFGSSPAWGFAVLGLREGDSLQAVQHAYRALMKKLHPDRVRHTDGVACAIEMLREAKQCCERALSQEDPPGQPRRLRYKTLCAVPGRRRIRLEWEAPMSHEGSPVRQYVVAALDPGYGRALTITVLEPYFCESRGRFLSADEIGSYVLEEAELKKMPGLFRQQEASFSVAAANDAGQSSWATLIVPLTDAFAAFGLGASSSVGGGTQSLRAGGTSSASAKSSDAAAKAKAQPKAKAAAVDNSCSATQCRKFDAQLREHRGGGTAELEAWLRKKEQSKQLLAAWLRSRSWPSDGSKEDLIGRVVVAVGGSGR